MLSKISLPPHNKTNNDTQKIMLQVIFALIPAIVASIYLYGYNVIINYLVSIISCVFFEYIFNKTTKAKTTITDYSAVITGILLVMCLSPNTPHWITVTGAFVSIVIGKLVFGGLGQNPFNPAIFGRTFLMLSFTQQTSVWTVIDQVSGATTLTDYKTTMTTFSSITPSTFEPISVIISSGSALGEASPIAIIIGGLYLLYKRIISWHIPVSFITSVFVLSFILWGISPETKLDPFTHIFSGAVLLGAFFMATDYSSSPLFTRGKILFGIGCGVITVVIRSYGSFPEGVGFAILIMNAFVPILDRYFRIRTFGKVGNA